MMISGKARLAGVMGWPVGHSRSPRLHGYWLEKHGIDGAYLPLAVRPDDLQDALRALPKLGFRGCNLTVPHKEAAMRIVDRVDETARRIGAINTVIVEDDGTLSGRNTDAPGFIANLLQGAPGLALDGASAFVLGAGGAARGVIAGLIEAGVVEIKLANRSPDKTNALVRAFEPYVVPVPWDERADRLDDIDLLVNTTSLGMQGQPALDLPLDGLAEAAVVTDIVYAPLETDLLARAKARGNRTVDGLGMLLHQAVPGFAAWFGLVPEVTEELRRHVLAR
ncbi:shikimate dehydrogenase [Zavarzinia compransoris]|uniref:Shikimate dehydrogenase (NADP(+)) n=1 Tax=Zavarzinia compransoris TaxID=1264899 RepID=A0A317E2M4_9PROT|nr:shikimate dehydrogenase [Zavarzinia compransoris]PWR20664.1 shikimate dehydrogenase [Zavarzinia compransoris]TDP44514.1 shikimate dehydrogenase [Zavarzinia compransoris]